MVYTLDECVTKFIKEIYDDVDVFTPIDILAYDRFINMLNYIPLHLLSKFSAILDGAGTPILLLDGDDRCIHITPWKDGGLVLTVSFLPQFIAFEDIEQLNQKLFKLSRLLGEK